MLVAASLKRLQDEREAGSAANADAVEGGGGGGGGVLSGGGGGAASGGGGGQEKQASAASAVSAAAAPMSSGFTLDQLHTELHQLLAVKVCVRRARVFVLLLASAALSGCDQ